MLLLSTLPIDSAIIYRLNEEAWPALIAALDVPGTGSIRLVLVHATDPIQASGLQLRDEFLAAIAPIIAGLDGPVIVAGDFNATPFTPAFRRFLVDARVLPPRALPGSYPANFGALGLPIDHILLRDADLSAVRALPATGSDHRPILAHIVLPAEPSTSLAAAHSPESPR
jgi:endonuclease/exonuclease/phosphatase (EEP) superfamily protein YafD